MGNHIKVNTAALRRDATELKALSVRAVRQIKTMQNDIVALSRMWDGPAKSAFLQQFEIDADLFLEICQGISQFSNDLDKASREYDKCENSVLDAVKAIRV